MSWHTNFDENILSQKGQTFLKNMIKSKSPKLWPTSCNGIQSFDELFKVKHSFKNDQIKKPQGHTNLYIIMNKHALF
jgi:hypothetical protein